MNYFPENISKLIEFKDVLRAFEVLKQNVSQL